METANIVAYILGLFTGSIGATVVLACVVVGARSERGN